MTFTARYPGHCHADCGRTITPGDDVTYVDDELVHVDCTPRHERPVVICDTCHLTRPCDCEPAAASERQQATAAAIGGLIAPAAFERALLDSRKDF
jgi:hypothetical protein